jgi:hypothetical protein
MAWITENPLPLLILGLLAQVILGLILWQTGRGWLMFVMIMLAITNVVLLVLSFVIVTEKEEIAGTLKQLGQTLELNQPDKVMEFISPSASALRGNATRLLKRVKIYEARVASEVDVRFDVPSSTEAQPSATVVFLARIRAKDTKDTSPYEQLAQRFKVKMRKENDHWLVTEYEANRGW